MRRNILIAALLLFLIYTGKPGIATAQLKGISYSFTPIADYSFTGKNAGIADVPSAGGQIGFRFGEYFGLSALYLKSINANTDFESLVENRVLIADKSASLERLGGEFQANFSRKKLIPCITLGTGVQTASAENTEKNKQIYLTLGSGLAYHLHDRINMGLQAVNTTYRINAYNTYMTPEERAASTVAILPTSSRYISDWSARIKLSLLLGGIPTGKLSEFDLALLEQYNDGLKGPSLQLEPTFMYVNFNRNLPFNDAFYTGLSTGFDFGPFIGIRAFYLHELDESSILSLNKSSVWGGETKFKLNIAHGIVPFLSLGGGRINALSGYLPDNGLEPENKVFASGGLGLELPLSRRIKLMGFTKGMFTSIQKSNEIIEPENIISNMAYGLKIGFSMGKKQQTTENEITKKSNELKKEYINKQENDRAIQEYQILLNEKNAEISHKNAIIDSLHASVHEKKVDKQISEELVTEPEKSSSIIQITPDELVSILREFKELSGILNPPLIKDDSNEIKKETAENKKEIKQKDTLDLKQNTVFYVTEHVKKDTIVVLDSIMVFQTPGVSVPGYDYLVQVVTEIQEAIGSLNNKIDVLSTNSQQQNNELSSLITGLTNRISQLEEYTASLSGIADNGEVAEKNYKNLTKELKGTKKNIEDIAKQLHKLENEIKKFVIQPGISIGVDLDTTRIPVSEASKKEIKKVSYSHISVFGGPGFGNTFTFNLGLRPKYDITDSFFSIVPETYIGIGSPMHLGLFINAVYDIQIKNSGYGPYFGIGTGLLAPGDDSFTGVFNILLGSYISRIAEGLHIDFTTRNFFKYNQVSVGYDLPF